MDDRSAALAAHLLAALERLRSGDAAAAVEGLTLVAEDAELAAAPDLRDIRARACSLLAQALMEAGRPEAALRWADTALALARSSGDVEGVQEVGGMRERLEHEARARRDREVHQRSQEALARVPFEEVLGRAAPGPAGAELLIHRAAAELGFGSAERAADMARVALERAGEEATRARVLAHLLLARAEPGDRAEHVLEAWRCADAANDFTLVGAVARAAQEAGVALPVLLGPPPGSAT